jgi:type I restriction enzyme S subunit
MSVENKVPAIRFKGFSGGWEECSVGEITVFHKQGFYTTESYGQSKKYYLLRGTDLANNKVVLNSTPKIDASEKDFRDFKVEVGDVLLVRSGSVGTYGIVYENIKGIFGSYLINFRFNQLMVVNEFFGCFYQSDRFHRQLRKIIQQSANTNINAENIKSVEIYLSSLLEQTKIGDYFQQLDTLIAQHQQKHDKLLNLKKALLELMFPKQGATVPEIRFKGFSGEWEERRLGELCQETYGGGTPRTSISEYWDGDLPWIQSSDLSEGKVVNIDARRKISKSGLKNSATKLVPAESIAIVTRVGVGKMSLMQKEYATSQDFLSLSKLKIDPLYGVYSIWKMLQIEKLGVQGTSIKGITKEELLSKAIDVPVSDIEQNKIGNLFQQLDTLITQHQAQLKKLGNIKQACLEKMFV